MNRGQSAGVWRIWIVGLVLMFVGTHCALAHKGSDAYLDLRQVASAVTPAPDAAAPAEAAAHGIRFVLSVALRDLDQVVAIDADSDARLTWGEVRRATGQVLALLEQTVQLIPGAPADGAASTQGSFDGVVASNCTLHWQADGLERRGDGSYFRAVATASCPGTMALNLGYSLLRAQDANHRLLVTGRVDGQDLLSTVSPQDDTVLPLRRVAAAAAGASSGDRSRAGRWATLTGYFSFGLQHLLQGYDHLAFLLALVLPLQLKLQLRPDRAAAAVASSRGDWWALLRTVTAFTLGHSITLIFATLGWTQASPEWVEPVIALSIIATAALNLRPLPGLRAEWLALGFGMVHGYGFAGLLQEAAAPDGLLGWALVGFNLGVEAGQLLAVAAWVLSAQWLVGRSWYRPVVVRGGSVLLMGLASAWLWQRIA